MLYILNGPNLNRLGTREPEVYGSQTLSDIEKRCRELAGDVKVRFAQSNHEGELIDWLHEAADEAGVVILNPGALTHTSVGLLDAVAAIDVPVIEVHLSQTAAREEFRHTSYVGRAAHGTITGFGALSYELAVKAALEMMKKAD